MLRLLPRPAPLYPAPPPDTGHCTSTDLLEWNCSHPSTGWNMSNTGGITITPAGYFLTQANNYNVSVARAKDAKYKGGLVF